MPCCRATIASRDNRGPAGRPDLGRRSTAGGPARAGRMASAAGASWSPPMTLVAGSARITRGRLRRGRQRQWRRRGQTKARAGRRRLGQWGRLLRGRRLIRRRAAAEHRIVRQRLHIERLDAGWRQGRRRCVAAERMPETQGADAQQHQPNHQRDDAAGTGPRQGASRRPGPAAANQDEWSNPSCRPVESKLYT